MLFQAGLVFPENLPEIQILILMYPRDRGISDQKFPLVPKMSDSNRKYWSVSTVGMVGIISFHITSVIANYTEQSEQHHKVAREKVHHLVVRRFIGHVPDEFTSLQNRFFQNHFKSKLQQAVNNEVQAAALQSVGLQSAAM